MNEHLPCRAEVENKYDNISSCIIDVQLSAIFKSEDSEYCDYKIRYSDGRTLKQYRNIKKITRLKHFPIKILLPITQPLKMTYEFTSPPIAQKLCLFPYIFANTGLYQYFPPSPA